METGYKLVNSMGVIMKWSSESVLLVILIAALSDSRSKAEINFLNRYVTPNRTVRCFNGQLPCQTLEQYATQPEMYFMNNSYLLLFPTWKPSTE